VTQSVRNVTALGEIQQNTFNINSLTQVHGIDFFVSGWIQLK